MLQNERARPSGLSSGTVHHFRSVSYPVLLGGGSWTWPGCDGLAPWASTASQYTAPNSLKKHCSLSVSATGKPGSDQLPPFFGVLYAYIYEYEYIVRMCTNVVVFLIRSEKYARYYYDLSSYVFALISFFSFTFLSIFNFLLLMHDTLLHYLRNIKTRESENPLKHKGPPRS